MEVEAKIRPAVMFDLDGCVSNDEWRRSRIGNKSPEEWAHYHAGCDQDDPLAAGAAILKQHIESKHVILFTTGRPFSVAEKSSLWIQKNFGINSQDDFSILMRKDDDLRSNVTLKTEFAQFILQNAERNKSAIVAAYDDRQDVVDMYRSLGINACVLNEKGLVHPAAAPLPPFAEGDDESLTAPKDVPQFLLEAAALYAERNAGYKDNYKRIGEVYMKIFPEGITLDSPDRFNRFMLFMMIMHKATRYAFAFDQGGHPDSLDDLAVYAMMLKELDTQ